MGVDVAGLLPGQVVVAESPRRLGREEGYGYVCAGWVSRWSDGRIAASVPPGIGEPVRRVLQGWPEDCLAPEPIAALRKEVDGALQLAGLKAVNRIFADVVFVCNRGTFIQPPQGVDCRRVAAADWPTAEGIALPQHCFPDGVVFGAMVDGRVVSVGYSHRSGLMEAQVADLGVETAEEFRRKGYAKAVVAAVVAHILAAGGEARYVTRPDNFASIATAKSVGFVPYGQSLILSAPAPDLE